MDFDGLGEYRLRGLDRKNVVLGKRRRRSPQHSTPARSANGIRGRSSDAHRRLALFSFAEIRPISCMLRDFERWSFQHCSKLVQIDNSLWTTEILSYLLSDTDAGAARIDHQRQFVEGASIQKD